MGNADEYQREELLEAHSLVWNQIFSVINSGSLRCAVQLGVPDVIHSHGKPLALRELVAALPIKQPKAQGIHHLMRVLVDSGFFAQRKISQTEQEEGYVLTPASRPPPKKRVVECESIRPNYVSSCSGTTLELHERLVPK